MWLAFSAIPREQAEARFPPILDSCSEFGLNPLEQPIPVAPAAHYWMGGVATDLSASTSLPGLYAVGEVACTGLHGANRLASNSLMECLVFAHRLANIDLEPVSSEQSRGSPRSCDVGLGGGESSKGLIERIDALRHLCWRTAGVDRGLKELRCGVEQIRSERNQLSSQALLRELLDHDHLDSRQLSDGSRKDLNLLLDLHHRLITSRLMLEACLFRRESRGGHFRTDAPRMLPHWNCHSRQSKGVGIVTRAVRM